MGDPIYAEVLAKIPWSFSEDKKSIFANYKNTNLQSDFQEAFRIDKNGNWRVIYFRYDRDFIGIDKLICKGYDDTSNCIKKDRFNSTYYHIKTLLGSVFEKARLDKDGNLLPGSIIYAQARYTDANKNIKDILVSLQYTFGDGFDASSFKGASQELSFTEILEKHPTSEPFIFSLDLNEAGFQIGDIPGRKDYRQLVFENIPFYKDLIHGKTLPPNFIVLPDQKQSSRLFD